MEEKGSAIYHSGVFCLSLMFQYLKKPVDMQAIQHEFCPDGGDLTPISMVRAARKTGLKAREKRIKPSRISKYPLPLIAINTEGTFFIIAAIQGGNALIQKAGMPPTSIPLEDLLLEWQGHSVLITSRNRLPDTLNHFDLSWFVPVIVKYRKLFRDILIASFFLQLFALCVPLIFQVVMDKVLVHRAEMTLNVLVIALLCISVFEVVLGSLRTYVFTHTTNRVDIELGTQLFRHLLSLPILFFHSRPVGQVVARVRELENIRDFLTGSALTLVMDLFFSLIFIVVMFFYSQKLAWIVIGSIPFYVIISIWITPELRKRTEERFHRSAINQAFLTESLTGIETLKAMAVEPQMRERWEEQLAGYARASFRAVMLGTYGSQSVQLVSKVVTALLMWQGSIEVIHSVMTVGELIAFNMLSGQIAGPILRLAQLWQDFQQFRISMDRLGDVINTPPESEVNLQQPAMPDIKGSIHLDNVVFRYTPSGSEVLKQLSLNIPAGQLVGVAGRSGSGKSTISKLIQRLYIPESGKIFIDGHNTALLNPAWLRRQIGIVLQDNVLFTGSIRDNIALSVPAAEMESVIHAAELAGAHEFICQLPQGYHTELGERGVGLSGGQLQRLAIARALVNNPKIVIFD
ncbi:MAG: type I secretion system permease/ATPase, partial [Endozoicomonas sp.]